MRLPIRSCSCAARAAKRFRVRRSRSAATRRCWGRRGGNYFKSGRYQSPLVRRSRAVIYTGEIWKHLNVEVVCDDASLSCFSAVRLGAWPFGVRAQPATQLRRIGVLMPYADDAVARARLSQFVHGLEVLGWVVGRDVRIDYYFANSDLGRMRTYAANLAATAPDVIFAATPQVLAALKHETNSIPVVFV